jgi:hypothetical protein
MWLKADGDRAGVERACMSEGVLGLGWGYHWSGEPAPEQVTLDVYSPGGRAKPTDLPVRKACEQGCP